MARSLSRQSWKDRPNAKIIAGAITSVIIIGWIAVLALAFLFLR